MISINEYDFKMRRAIIRVDFNVPIDSQKNVLDNSRIKAAKSTIFKVINDGGSVILMSHLGRPNGKDLNLSLRHIIPELEKILNHKVLFADDSMGPATQAISKNLKSGEILLLENLRFYPEETNGDEDFAKQLSSYADCYINDAFGTAHRAHAQRLLLLNSLRTTNFLAIYFLKKWMQLTKFLKQEKNQF